MPLDYMYGFTLKLKIKIKVHLIVWFLTNMLSSLPFLHFLFGCVVCLSAQQAHLSQKKKRTKAEVALGLGWSLVSDLGPQGCPQTGLTHFTCIPNSNRKAVCKE